MLPLHKQTRTRTHNHKQGDSNNVKLTPYKTIKVGHWSVILEQRGENVLFFFCFFFSSQPCFLGTSSSGTTAAYQMQGERSNVWLSAVN